MKNNSLVVAGILSGLAAVLHLSVIVGGADWYRFFGAGEEMAVLAEQGSVYPTIITLIISTILFAWAGYAFSGAGLIKRLPFLRFCLVAITSVYLIRGSAGLIVAFIPSSYQVQALGFEFMLWSSLICLFFGLVHLSGVVKGWRSFSPIRA